MIRRVYVQQFGSFWSLSPKAWSTCIVYAMGGRGWDFDKPHTLGVPPGECRRLKTPPSTARKGEGRYYSTANAYPIVHPLDWSPADWKDAWTDFFPTGGPA
jgi:hypothetical protein